MKKRNSLWIVEAHSSSPGWTPVLAFASGTDKHIPGVHLNRERARAAAKKMQATNSLNHPRFPKTVVYRATKYTSCKS